jgi:drug/metabolite transporter (DMT)-like permease
MTLRQVISIVLSAVVFNHSFHPQKWVGVMVVSLSLFAKVYFKSFKGASKKALAVAADAEAKAKHV